MTVHQPSKTKHKAASLTLAVKHEASEERACVIGRYGEGGGGDKPWGKAMACLNND